MFPTNSRRKASAATSRPRRSSPAAFASSAHCSHVSTAPSSVSITRSSAARDWRLMRGAISGHSSEGKFSSSAWARMRIISPPRKQILAKQIARCRTNKLTSPSTPRTVMESSNDTRRRASQLAADQACSASQFIGDGFHGYAQRITVGIAVPSIVVQGLHPGNANRNFGQAFPPGTPKTISDDDGNEKFQTFLQLAMELSGRAVGVFGKQKRVAAAVDVRNIHSTVGADQAVLGFRDHDAALAPHHSLALGESHLGYPCVEVVPPRPRTGAWGRFDAIQFNQPAFRFGDDFVLYDQDVALP